MNEHLKTMDLFPEFECDQRKPIVTPVPKVERYEIPRYRVSLVREGFLTTDTPTFSCPQNVYRFIKTLFSDMDREQLVVLMVDTKNKLIGVNVVSIGTLTSSLVAASNVFKPALLCNSAAVLIAHNHPSGVPDPSFEDRQVTAKIKEAGELLQIPLLDHIIIGEGRWYSFKEAEQI